MLAWGVLFGDGDALSAGKTDHDYVRAVRCGFTTVLVAGSRAALLSNTDKHWEHSGVTPFRWTVLGCGNRRLLNDSSRS